MYGDKPSSYMPNYQTKLIAKLQKAAPSAPPHYNERFNLSMTRLTHLTFAIHSMHPEHFTLPLGQFPLHPVQCNMHSLFFTVWRQTKMYLFTLWMMMRHSIIGGILNVFAVVPSPLSSNVPSQYTPLHLYLFCNHSALIYPLWIVFDDNESDFL